MKQKFEDFLEDRFMEDYHGDKEHFEDAFSNWLTDLDVQEIIDFADSWGDAIRTSK